MKARPDIKQCFGLALELMVIADGDGHFVRVNPAVEQTLGYTPQELTGRPSSEFIHPNDRQGAGHTYAAQAAGRTVTAFENRYRCPGRLLRWLL